MNLLFECGTDHPWLEFIACGLMFIMLKLVMLYKIVLGDVKELKRIPDTLPSEENGLGKKNTY